MESQGLVALVAAAASVAAELVAVMAAVAVAPVAVAPVAMAPLLVARVIPVAPVARVANTILHEIILGTFSNSILNLIEFLNEFHHLESLSNYQQVNEFLVELSS